MVEIHRLAEPCDGLEPGRIGTQRLIATDRPDRRQRPDGGPDHRRGMSVAGCFPVIHFLEMGCAGVDEGGLRRGQARADAKNRCRPVAKITRGGQQQSRLRRPIAAEHTAKNVDE